MRDESILLSRVYISIGNQYLLQDLSALNKLSCANILINNDKLYENLLPPSKELNAIPKFPLTKSDVPPNSIHLTANPALGSRQHYYHFLLGVLLPFVNWYIDSMEYPNLPIIIQSCDLFDKHLNSLNIPNLIIKKHPDFEFCRYFSSTLVSLPNFDFPENYNIKDIQCSSNYLIGKAKYFNQTHFQDASNLSFPKILLINRCIPDDFYNSPESESKTSGIQRRSVPNFQDIYNEIKKYCPVKVELEHIDLFTQINLFHQADIVIAQHGAALSNIVFCKTDAVIMEFVVGSHRKYFSNLASLLNLKYIPLHQESEHAPVNIQELRRALSSLLS